MTDEDYGHHAPDYDPRGSDFDHPHLTRSVREVNAMAQPDQRCPVCGAVHERHAHDE